MAEGGSSGEDSPSRSYLAVEKLMPKLIEKCKGSVRRLAERFSAEDMITPLQKTTAFEEHNDDGKAAVMIFSGVLRTIARKKSAINSLVRILREEGFDDLASKLCEAVFTPELPDSPNTPTGGIHPKNKLKKGASWHSGIYKEASPPPETGMCKSVEPDSGIASRNPTGLQAQLVSNSEPQLHELVHGQFSQPKLLSASLGFLSTDNSTSSDANGVEEDGASYKPTLESTSPPPSATTSNNADEDNKKWASGVPQSSSQQPVEANLNASSASVDVERQPHASGHLYSTETAPPGEWGDQLPAHDSHHSAQASTPAVDNPTTDTTTDDGSVRPSFCQPGSLQPSAWKNQIPTLDPYQPTLASPPSPSNLPDSTITDEGGAHASFTVGQPDSLPHEEENVESYSAMIVQKPEMPITGDAKKDKEKILRLEAKLRKTEAKVTDLKKKLAATTREKEQGQRDLEEAKKEIERVKVKGKKDSDKMQKEHDDEIANLKKMLADAEKKSSDQKVEFCKEIKRLHDKLEEQKNKHNQEVIKLINDKHKLELKVERMNTNEEKLKRELSEASHKATKLQHELELQKCEEERRMSSMELQKRDEAISVLRTESAEEMKKKDDEIQKLRQQLSCQMTLESPSSQGPGTEENSEP